MQKINKPWGYEIIFAHTIKYVGKILHINKGERLSLQYHKIKDETIYLQGGEIILEIHQGAKIYSINLPVGASFHIPPDTVHRIIAVEDSDVLETSTPELDDVVRLQDSYGRV